MIQLRLLGSLELLGPDGARMDAALRRSKVVAVLAYLAAARPRGPQRRDKVAAFFWPDLSTERARAALRVTLTRLRDEVGAEVIVSSGADEIAVDASRVWCDVVELDERIARGDAAAAADLYRGPFLDGVHVEGTDVELEQWISAERTRIRADVQRALSQASAAAERAGQRESAALIARRAAEITPEDETVNRRLITLLLAMGDRGGALHAYDALATRLERDFGVTPSPETRALVAAIQPEPPRDRAAPLVAIATGTSGLVSRGQPVMSPRRIALPALAAAVVVLLAGAALARGYASASSDRATMHWSMVKPAQGPIPRGRHGREAILDSTGNGILVFGGLEFGGAENSTISNELSRLRGFRDGESAQWSRVAPSGNAAPAPRSMFGMTYDAAHDRAIVYGGGLGFLSPCASDTWVLDHASGIGAAPSWRRVALHGASAPARAGIRLVYDSVSRRLIVFGGVDCISIFYRDVWVLAFDDSSMSSGRWVQLPVDTGGGVPLGRESYSAAYDAAANRLFMHAGRNAAGALGELWALEHANGLGGTPSWRLLNCAGPAPVRSHEAAFFDTSGALTVFGGADRASDFHRDLWRVSGLRGAFQRCRWQQLEWSEPAPSARGGASALRDARTGAVILFGGHFQTTAFSDAWVLSQLPKR